MVQEVPMYRTSDGTVFESNDDAVVHESGLKNKVAIDTFIDKHFPIPAPELMTNEDGSPKLDAKGVQEKKPKQNNGRGPARRALSLWLAENPAA